ncbi:MAG: hypothetical protein EOO49_15600 [Flavobacterium sp.]|nr:MAG: hypothetical protein EOO49_15600 [Flavobacterium sp.]
MLSKVFFAELKWVCLALALSLLLVDSLNDGSLALTSGFGSHFTFLGLNLFLEILVFFVLSIFVVFGIKGFFERFSQKSANIILLLTGLSMAVAVFFLSYQILFQE